MGVQIPLPAPKSLPIFPMILPTTNSQFLPDGTDDYVDNYLQDFNAADSSLCALRVSGDCTEPKLKKMI